MARKSRKDIILVKEESKKIYNAGGYVRLSVAKENENPIQSKTKSR